MTRLGLTRTFNQQDFDRFAALSGDANPIHVDAGFAARTRFGRTVAHGVLLETVLRGLAGQLAPGRCVAEQALRFSAPTYADEPMRFEAWREDDATLGLNVTRAADGTLTCDGRMTLAEAAAPRLNPLPDLLPAPDTAARLTPAPCGPLRLGMIAALTRRFSAGDVAEYTALGGHAPAPGTVPEPLIGALFSTLLGMELPGLGTNYLKQETRHLRPARLGEPLTAQVEITGLRLEKNLVDLATRCHNAQDRLIAEGRALVYVRDVAR
ncbi:MaoC family dehydratase [Pedomonas mirosovicensis]|uniref:MaoC family dehydratase n=1 Tax=Pedomonas mirosovicensis TaxID=2908641 RepID=UPI00216A3417|nr:MaoC/PaaZ C-terminal domain-containing protein [Pedomonas mirosovicensis]MCH8683975.1 hypothetical protein [Pedomonas mirosovicensis]